METPNTTEVGSQPRVLRIGTRSSTLALAQVTIFTSILPPSVKTSTHAISSSPGDTDKISSLSSLATLPEGKSLWTSSLEEQLSKNEVDVLVHSLKDVPTTLPAGFECVAVGHRGDAGDCVVFSPDLKARGIKTLKELEKLQAEGGKRRVVGTSSVRRKAMLARNFLDFEVKECRGNVPTRLRKLEDGQYDAIVIASAGVKRLGLWEKVDETLQGVRGGGVSEAEAGLKVAATKATTLEWGHAVGQGAIGIEWRANDHFISSLIQDIEASTGKKPRWEGLAERALLRVLEGGCSVPVGVECWWQPNTTGTGQAASASKVSATQYHKGEILFLNSMVVSVDGTRQVQCTRHALIASDQDAETLGLESAEELVKSGAAEILTEIEATRARTKVEGYVEPQTQVHAQVT